MHVALVRHTVAGRPLHLLALGLLAAVSSLAPAAARADAWSPVDRVPAVQQGPLAVSVRIEGRGTPLYQRADRGDRWYIEAREGANYAVTVRNLTGERVGFVISVDGLNAINGLRSHQGADEPMYVLDPYEQTTIQGWRKSLDNVSRFVFVDEERSYAARTDQANGDLGWIRVVAFNERPPVAWRAPIAPMAPNPTTWGATKRQYDGGSGSSGAAPAPAAPSTRALVKGGANAPEGTRQDMDPLAEGRAEEASPGTGWGTNQRDHVEEVEFRAQPYAAAQVILRYEYHDALERLGVLPWRPPVRDRLRERENGELGFAQPPKW